MPNPDFTVKHLGEATIDSPLNGVGFIPEDSTVTTYYTNFAAAV